MRSLFLFLVACFLVTLKKANAFGSSFGRKSTTIDVWNNVICVDHLAPALHEESTNLGLGHRVFSRSLLSTHNNNNNKNNNSNSNNNSNNISNIIEQTLDSILTELNDSSPFVEYWTRKEWRSIQAHADVDEYRAKQEQEQQSDNTEEMPLFRYPQNGHVLYLQVGNQVRGPTCVFANRKSGGDLIRRELTEKGKIVDDDDADDADDVELVTVPAVPGRLLRFQGDYLHAVPRPTDLWLLKFVQGAPVYEPEEEWGRSVVLFNTWNEPPIGLPFENENNNLHPSDDIEQIPYYCNKMNEWSRVGPSSNPTECNSASKEVSYLSQGTTIIDDEMTTKKEKKLSAKIWLLGDYRRRDHRLQTVHLEATESLREALYQETDVMSTKLQIPVSI